MFFEFQASLFGSITVLCYNWVFEIGFKSNYEPMKMQNKLRVLATNCSRLYLCFANFIDPSRFMIAIVLF